MNAYREYMDTVVLSDAIRRRIASGGYTRPRRLPYRTALIATCAVLVAICAFAVPQLLYEPPLIAPPEPPPSIAPTATAAVPTADVTAATPTPYPLDFVVKDALPVDVGRLYAEGVFSLPLDDDDFRALLSGAYETMTATRTLSGYAFFTPDGKPLEVYINTENTETGAKAQISLDQYIYSMLVTDVPEPTDLDGTDVYATAYANVDGVIIEYTACYAHENTYCYVTSADETELKELVSTLVTGGAADMWVLVPDYIPEYRNEILTFDEATADETYGAFVPDYTPRGFRFDYADRHVSQHTDSMILRYASGRAEIRVVLRAVYDGETVVDITKPEMYDMSLYSIPLADSVPPEYRETMSNPVFRAEDFSRDVVDARAYTVSDSGDVSGERLNFGVLIDGVVIDVSGKGIDRAEIYALVADMLDI